MKSKKSIYKISGILVLVVFMLGFVLTGCTAQNKTAGQATTSQAETTTAAEATATVTIATTAVETTAVETTAVETQSTEQLLEQPDKAKYDEYFTDFYLGKLPLGQQMPNIDPSSPGLIKTSVFIASEDKFCAVGTLKKDIPSGSFYIAVYDTVAEKDFTPKTAFPIALSAGDFGWKDDRINSRTSKYELKLYIDDALVAVIPFEIR